jgi:hypothetical protein
MTCQSAPPVAEPPGLFSICDLLSMRGGAAEGRREAGDQTRHSERATTTGRTSREDALCGVSA